MNPYFKSRNDPNDQDSGKIRHMNVTGAWSQGKFSKIWFCHFLYREDLEKQEESGSVAHERLTEPRVTIE